MARAPSKPSLDSIFSGLKIVNVPASVSAAAKRDIKTIFVEALDRQVKYAGLMADGNMTVDLGKKDINGNPVMADLPGRLVWWKDIGKGYKVFVPKHGVHKLRLPGQELGSAPQGIQFKELDEVEGIVEKIKLAVDNGYYDEIFEEAEQLSEEATSKARLTRRSNKS